MKTYTQQDFDAFEIDARGYKICPSGDYRQINYFGEKCSFDDGCIIGHKTTCDEECRFDRWCNFGDGCLFRKECIFGNLCHFGEGCSFGKRCNFGGWCDFGKECSFDRWCSFGEDCSFGKVCYFGKNSHFGELCDFGEKCSFENIGESKPGYPFIILTGGGSSEGSKVYFFNLQAGIYVRCGCFLGTLDEFRTHMKDNQSDPLYLDFADLAEKSLKDRGEKEFSESESSR